MASELAAGSSLAKRLRLLVFSSVNSGAQRVSRPWASDSPVVRNATGLGIGPLARAMRAPVFAGTGIVRG